MKMCEHNEKFCKRDTSQSGFTMIEMMIAMVIITVGLVSIVAISAYVSRTNSVSNRLSVLATAAQDQVDRLRTARWGRTTEDPMVSVGGSYAVAEVEEVVPDGEGGVTPLSVTQPLAAGSPSVQETYEYELDPEDPHRASARGTPIGTLNIMWQVTQGPTPDIRYVTIRVVEATRPPNLVEGFTVSTMIVRN